EMLPEIKFNKERMREACQSGYITATDLAEYLVKKGIPFRQAHEITGKIVLYCIEKEKTLTELSIKEFKRFSDKIEKDVYTILNPEGSIEAKASYGSTAKRSVKEQIKLLRKSLKE
ncbi:MAG: argininosuccinate lyase, partial [Thermodesulfovibrio sp.]|nr:argininosuccinate lyase [Thermodesulfovibrio sp.]